MVKLDKYKIIDIKEEMNLLVSNGYISENGKPLKCQHCNSGNLKHGKEYYGVVGLEEFEMICVDCNKKVGNWAYGNWEL